MKQLQPTWPIFLPWRIHLICSHPSPALKRNAHMSRNNQNQRQNQQPSKPRLTHFLCLPLVNETSLPQLETSLATFKAAIPLNERQNGPLIPHDALRPLGTLHLTLGVMSLPTPERLNEALEFFHSLDLVALMRTVEERTTIWRRNQHQQSNTQDKSLSTTTVFRNESPSGTNSNPFTISLESLYALPRARSATVLYASPVDPTSRLYPFCEALRDLFLEAGFIQPDYKKENARNKLLLHATVVNTIYVRGSKRSRDPRNSNFKNHNNRKQSNDRFTFDARDILSSYRGSAYVDGEASPSESNYNRSLPPATTASPFVWAKDFSLESVCICEMGAKKLDVNGDKDGMNRRLGEKYSVVAERELTFTIGRDVPS